MAAQLIETGTEAEWLAARRQGVTASEIAVVMGLSPYDSPFALYHRKRGDLPDIEDSLSMRVGRHNESLAAELFAERRPEFTVDGDGRTLYTHPARPWQMATPDRLVWERDNDRFWPRGGYQNAPDAVLECKKAVSYDHWGDDGSDEIPVHHRCQVLWQCDVMGVDSWFLVCLFLHSDQVRVYEGVIDSRAEADLRLMRIEALAFLDRLQGCGGPPDPDWRPATAAALKHLHPSVEDREAVVGVRTAISYRAACRRYKEAERRKNEMTSRLRAEMGSARTAVTRRGEQVAARQVYEVKEHTRKASTTDKLVPAKPPKDAAS